MTQNHSDEKTTTANQIIFWVITGLLGVHAISYLFPIDPQTHQYIAQRMGESVYSVLILAAAIIRQRQCPIGKERLFWLTVSMAAGIWTLVKLSFLLGGGVVFDTYPQQLADFGYFLFYLLFVSALQINLDEEDQLEIFSIEKIASLLFVLGSYSYLVLIPNQFSSSGIRDASASYTFYLLMDSFLLLHLLLLIFSNANSQWRRVFIIMSGYFALLMVADALELAIRFTWISIPTPSLWDIVWFIPYVAFAALFLQTSALQQSIPTTKEQKFLPPSQSLVIAFSLPLGHIIGYATGWLDESSHQMREAVLVIWLITFGFLTFYLEVVLRRRSRRYQQLLNKAEQTALQNLSEPESTNKDSAVLQQTGYGIVTLSAMGKILSVNPAILGMFNYREEELLNQSFGVLLAKDEPVDYDLRLSHFGPHAINRETPVNKEITCRHRSGELFSVYLGLRYLKDNDEELLVATLVDISEHKSAEAEALALQDKFIANISHEFRTPLTIINGVLEDALSRAGTDDEVYQLKTGQRNSHRMIKMVEQLLELSRLATLRELSMTNQNITDIAYSTSIAFEPIASQKQLEFTTKIPPDAWANVGGDGLDKVLVNLLSNAFKYTESGGKVNFELLDDGDHWLINVSDTGMGISQEQQQQIFDRYHRAIDGQNSNIFGVGIGLSLVNELIVAHKWKMMVSSEPGKGSCFSVRLPKEEPGQSRAISSPHEMPDIDLDEFVAVPPTRPQAKEACATKEKQHQLLVIEDNHDMQAYLNRLLSTEYHCQIHGTGLEGVEAAIEQVPDIIITDLMLPDIDGFEVLEQIKSNPITSHIPILMLTARSDTESRLQGLRHEADDYLTKPFNHEELSLRLDNLLKNRQKLQSYYQNLIGSEPSKLSALPKSATGSQDTLAEKFIEKLANVTEKHFADEEFGLTEMASQLAMSERQLQRKIKAILAVSPNEYLKEFRLIKAEALLRTNASITSVVDDTGFSSQSYFGRCFKEKYGQTPKAFQKSLFD